LDLNGQPRIPLTTRLKRAALAFDAWLNASLYSAGRRMSDGYERFSERSDKLRVRGFKRAVLDLTSEAATLGTGGAVVMLALALPAFRETSENWLKSQELAVTFLDRYGQEIGRRGIRHDDSVKLEEFPDYLIKAALATEDRRFFEHWGIDPIGTFRALSVNARGGGVVQGGSSITQQLAKNIFLNNERSLERKVKEAFLAVWLEFHLSKQDILKLYLDRAYMGGGTFGAAAAAEYYFGKSVKDISLAESAMLAGLFKAPTKYAPHVNLPAARARANDVLNNMVEAGFLTEGQIQTARRNPATPIDRKRDTTPEYYLDWAFEQVKKLAGQGKLGNDRVVVVKTPLDQGIQRKVEQASESLIRQYGNQYDFENAAMVVMDPDGAVRAMLGGQDYGQSQFNRATDAQRQPGSSFKTYVYSAALSAGLYRPNTVVTDTPVCIGNWCPGNYNRGSYAGSMPLTVAFAKSINTIPVIMSIKIGQATGVSHVANAAKIGRAKIIQTARAMGLTTPLNDTVSLPIGAAEVTVIDQAAGYAVFANGGKRARPYAAVEVRNSAGDVIYRHDSEKPPEQVLSTRVVADMSYMLNKVVEEGTGKRAMLDGVKAGGKTGTTNAYRDAWFVGFTGNLVGAVWMGNDDHTSTNKMTGGSVPAMLWREVMAYAHQNIELKPIPYLGTPGPEVARAAASGAQGGVVQLGQPTSGALSRRSFEVLGGIGALLKGAERPVAPLSTLPGSARAAADLPSATGGTRAVGGRIALP
jgi:penicillin-binding protein 1A